MANSVGFPFDPRSICNLILDEAEKADRAITNLALQKLLYFAHGQHLTETKRPLISGFFEAWRYGPVHPTAYHAYKAAGAEAIRFRASITDPFSGRSHPVPACSDPIAVARAQRVVRMYGSLTPGRLVEVSHAKNAPWAYILDKARTETVLGLRIANEVILERFRFHKVSVGLEPRHGEPREEAPFN